MTGLAAFIQALPEFIQLLNRLMSALTKLVMITQTHDFNVWISQLENSIDQLEKAVTAKDKQNAALSLDRSINELS